MKVSMFLSNNKVNASGLGVYQSLFLIFYLFNYFFGWYIEISIYHFYLLLFFFISNYWELSFNQDLRISVYYPTAVQYQPWRRKRTYIGVPCQTLLLRGSDKHHSFNNSLCSWGWAGWLSVLVRASAVYRQPQVRSLILTELSSTLWFTVFSLFLTYLHSGAIYLMFLHSLVTIHVYVGNIPRYISSRQQLVLQVLRCTMDARQSRSSIPASSQSACFFWGLTVWLPIPCPQM